ncbi:hypothetical protein BS50DRAFT_111420 [Corynespora cassiicola Philippines]|uniref:C2H2-type domain-containing protein n=1 Tax=Corynespora cassiicola Philippines TaxID=1448308 RepID=A0A2T2NDT5_CORCC|nr:hypothetical protein BS50DRAFT_111420 [Corynespora cassiicola Philippines]
MVGVDLAYCSSCNRHFKHQNALVAHLHTSARHNWRCEECDFNGEHRVDLIAHYRQTGCRHVCEGCAGGAGKGWIQDSSEFWDHVSRHHACTACGRHFNNASNLMHGPNKPLPPLQHQLTHQTPTTKCLCTTCPQKFTTYGGMLIHLESGACPSQTDLASLNKSAALCFQWRKWVVGGKEARRDLLRGVAVPEPGTPLFKCPACEVEVPRLSGLFMHAASPACAGGGKSLKKLKSKAESGKVEGRVGGRHGGGDELSAALGGMSLGAGERDAPIQARASGQADDDGLAAALGGMSLSGGKQRAPGQRRSFDDEAEDDWVLIESELGDMSLLDRGNGVQLEP